MFLKEKRSKMFESKTVDKKILKKRSLKKALIRSNYPIDLYTKVKTDRIGDEYGVRDSGMGFPLTVGPMYNESFSEYEPEIPSFTSDQRSMVPMDAYPEDKNIKKDDKVSKAVKRIKLVAKNCYQKSVG